MDLLEWDAHSYDGLPLPHTRWGAATLAKLTLAGSESVLELGAGTGRDCAALLDRLPAGHVFAVDGSKQMLASLSAKLADRADRVTVIEADLREPLRLAEPVDAAFSVATLHWLPDHQVVFESVATALRPGGQFVAEGGGLNNVESVRVALRDLGAEDGSSFWNFADAEPTAALLEQCGFTDVAAKVVPDPAVLLNREQLEAYLATVVLGAHLRDIDAADRRSFVAAVADRLPEPVIDYTRLQITARRAA